jgi:hypothetical protein
MAMFKSHRHEFEAYVRREAQKYADAKPLIEACLARSYQDDMARIPYETREVTISAESGALSYLEALCDRAGAPYTDMKLFGYTVVLDPSLPPDAFAFRNPPAN